jgi:NIMA (never in mitosis gene a)-related kinase 1/4/5
MYIHSKKIVHRDIKGANMFLSADKRVVRVGDLNVSKIANNRMLHTQTGTPYYASPEVWMDKPYDSKSDIWSLGCMIYEMCALKPPFVGKSLDELNSDVQKYFNTYLRGKFARIPSKYSDDLNSLICWMLQVNPNMRPSCIELLDKMHETRPELQSPNYIESENYDHPVDEDHDHMLDTIKLPNDLKLLDKKLPRSNYGSKHIPINQMKSRNQSALIVQVHKSSEGQPNGA